MSLAVHKTGNIKLLLVFIHLNNAMRKYLPQTSILNNRTQVITSVIYIIKEKTFTST